MKEPLLWTFHLQLKGVGALNRKQIKQLLSKLGEVTKIVFPPNSFSTQYSDVALVHVKRERTWDTKVTTLQYRQYGHVFKVSVAIINRPIKQAPKPRQQAGEAKGHGRVIGRKAFAETCRDHVRGKCTRGSTCRFSHAPSNSSAGAGAAAVADAPAAQVGARAGAGAAVSAPRLVVKANRTRSGADSRASSRLSSSASSSTCSSASSTRAAARAAAQPPARETAQPAARAAARAAVV